MINKFKFKDIISLFKSVLNGAIYNVDLDTDKETLDELTEIYENLFNIDFNKNQIAVSSTLESIRENILDTLYKFSPQMSDSVNNVNNAELLLYNIANIDNILKRDITGWSHFYIKDREIPSDSTSDTADFLIYLLIESNIEKWQKK